MSKHRTETTDPDRLMRDAKLMGKAIHVEAQMFGDTEVIAYLPIPLTVVDDIVWAEFNELYADASRLVEPPSVRNSIEMAENVELVDEEDSLFMSGDEDA